MQGHLAEGCEQCDKMLALVRRVVRAADADARYEVPESALHMARAIFALEKPERVQVLPRLVARLVFDSFREPAMAGVRSQQRLTRQAMYEAGEYCIDLRMEQERGATEVVLVGQIANSASPEQKLTNVPVVLMGGERVLSRAQSNEFGEFQMKYKPQHPLRLFVPVQLAGQEIELPLEELLQNDPGKAEN